MVDDIQRGAPPRDNLIRAAFPGVEVRAAETPGGMPTLVGHLAVFNQWTKIDSSIEGRFMERMSPGSFARTISSNRANIKPTFQHGKDPQLGDKPLGPITVLEEDGEGVRYEVPLLDTAYNRELVPGLEAGLYGSSFRFQVVKEDVNSKPGRSAYNPDGLPERTVKEVKLMEFGPVTYPAYPGATAGVRSMTDEYVLDRFTRDPERLADLIEHLRDGTPALPDAGPEAEPHSDEGTREDPPVIPDPPPDEPAPSPTEDPPEGGSSDSGRNTPVAETTSRADRPARITELRSNLDTFAQAHDGALSSEDQASWDGMTTELRQLEVDHKADEERRAFIQDRATLVGGIEGPSGNVGVPGDWTPTNPATIRRPNKVRDIYSIHEHRQAANGYGDEVNLLRDSARRAIEEARFSSMDRAEGQKLATQTLDETDDPNGYIARRILLTGSPVYRRYFHKTILGMTPTAEENGSLALFQENERAMGQVTGSAGGFGVTFDLDPTMVQTSTGAVVPFRRSSRVVTITTNEWRGVTSGGVVASYAAEAAVATDNSPTLVQPAAIVQKAHCFVPFSMEIQGDYAGLEAELGREIADAKNVLEATQFVTGAGTTVFPQGIQTGASTTINTGTTLVLAAADVYATEFTLSPRFRVNARWVANRAFYNRIRAIDTAGGAQLWTQNLTIGLPNVMDGNTGYKLLGYQADEASGFSTSIATTTYMAVFGDFQYYVIVDRVGLNLELVPILTQQATAGSGFAMPTGQRGLYAWWRNTAKTLSAAAFVGLKGL